MTLETMEIIKVCKSKHDLAESIDSFEAIKYYYIKHYCIYPDHYEDIGAYNMVKRAFYDYLDSCEKPSNLLRSFEDAMSRYIEMHYSEHTIEYASMVSALTLTQVRRDNKYINGFTEFMQQIVNLCEV